MNFNNPSYLLYILLVICLFVFAVVKYEKSYFNWVKTYWNYARTKRSLIASFLYLISMSLFLISLLDLRGPEENIKTSIPDQKTIIILDSSSSMLAEDIKPNRFSKAIQLARHFVKNSPGHQVAIVLFSDVQKRLMPFTDDVDLLDSRLAALDQVNSVGGGSNIAQAIQEATGYFQTEENKAGSGNILVFTDAEESDGGFNLKLDKSYNLAVVGIGSAKGAQIPIRWKDGSLRGYKESNGQPVLTKLDENYIKSLGKNVTNYHYWIANSYSLPTTEIASFFRNELEKNLEQGDMRIKPVYSHYILIPAIFVYVLSVVISRFASLRMLSLVFVLVFSFSSQEVFSNEDLNENKNQEVKLNPLVVAKMNSLKSGNFSNEEALKAAQNFLELQDYERASILYEEYLEEDSKIETKINAVSGFILAKQYAKGLELADKILSDAGVAESEKNILRSNLVFIFNQKGNEKSKGKDKDKNNSKEQDQNNQDNKENQDQKENKQDKQDQENKKDQQGKGDQEDKKDNKDSKDKSDPNQRDPKDSQDNKKKDLTDPKKEKDDGKKQDKPADKPQEKQAPQSLEEKEEQIREQRKMIKTPAMIKQILNDDRELQKQMMDTSTDAKGTTKKDW